MKNVTTPVLIQHNRDEAKGRAPCPSVLLRTLILRHIEKSCGIFETSIEDVKSQGKSSSEIEESMMTYFKFPNATYLTQTLF
jgi:hypothetical protein